MRVETPEPSIPSCLNRRPAVSMIRRRVSDLCSLPYRTTPHAPSPAGRTGCPSPPHPVYGIANVIQRADRGRRVSGRGAASVRQARAGISVVLSGVYQCEGVADALFEELVGELPVGEGAGELQGSGHHAEEAECLETC